MYSQCLPHGHKCMFGLIKVAHDNRLAEIAFVILIHLQDQLKHVHIDVISESGMVGDLCHRILGISQRDELQDSNWADSGSR